MASAYTASVLADGPSLYWLLNDPTGTTALDSSAAGTNTGTYSGGFTLAQPGGTASATDRAVVVNGTTGYVFRTSTPTALQSSYTLEAWFRCDDLTQLEQVVVCNGSNDNGIAILVNGNNATGNVAVLANMVQWGTAAVTLTQGAWYHVAVTVPGNSVGLYLNGSLLSAITMNTSRTPTAFSAGGAYNAGAITRPFKGAVARAALYAGNLDVTRIAAHYAAASGADQSAATRRHRIGRGDGAVNTQNHAGRR